MRAADYVDLGDCAFCGFPDAGHRVWDAIAERVRAGESERAVAADYGLTVQGVRALIRLSDIDDEPLRNRFSARKHAGSSRGTGQEGGV
ncbi:MAG: hypothetical protein ACRDH7_07590, partial [Actinomycetota bacterium]